MSKHESHYPSYPYKGGKTVKKSPLKEQIDSKKPSHG